LLSFQNSDTVFFLGKNEFVFRREGENEQAWVYSFQCLSEQQKVAVPSFDIVFFFLCLYTQRKLIEA